MQLFYGVMCIDLDVEFNAKRLGA